ncbi:hypothetical protein ACFQNJ_18515 [Hydrogenophaga bisanensis]|uniref:Uncharacterized protein n=1 Tax=Hydrogenophaga bisanensis TaxID=439611 RepID=A0ABW2REN4_9BURK
MKKHKGLCPFCSEEVIPDVIQDNTVRRDVCQCPSCSGKLLLCRVPGCTNYAKGGDLYDDELCPSCTTAVSSATGEVVKYASMVAAGVVATAAIGKAIKDEIG